MLSKKEKKNREKLFQLMNENLELPVVAMVDGRIVDDSSKRWRGAFGSAYVGEYVIGREYVYFREDDDLYGVDRTLSDCLDTPDYEDIEKDEEALKKYAELPWIKAIIVNIDLPE